MNQKNSRLVRVYSSTQATEAHLIRNALEDHGIQASLSGDALAHAGLGGVARVDVYTFEEQAAEAMEIIAARGTPDQEPQT